MSNQTLFLIMGIAGGGFFAIVIAYLVIRKALDKGDRKRNIKSYTIFTVVHHF